jgi:acetyltransferase-like isoleucine patch superfamily enzyme
MIKQIYDSLRKIIKKNNKYRFIAKSVRHPFAFIWGYIYGCYLTWRYVDDYEKFPAIVFQTAVIKLRISKGFGSKLEIRSRLIVEPLSQRRTPSSIVLGHCAIIKIENDFSVGDDVQIVAHDNARIEIQGNVLEGSGVTAKGLIHARSLITIGRDVIIAQDTYITDSDWHPIDGADIQRDVIIGDHVWIATGVRILKGSIIGNNCIVACGAVVTGHKFDDRTLIAGVPAKAAKSNISNWHRELHE